MLPNKWQGTGRPSSDIQWFVLMPCIILFEMFSFVTNAIATILNFVHCPGHTYSRKSLLQFIEAHQNCDNDTTIKEDENSRPDECQDNSISFIFLDTPLPSHKCVVDAAVSTGVDGGGVNTTLLMKQQVYPNLLALAAVDDFSTQVSALLNVAMCITYLVSSL